MFWKLHKDMHGITKVVPKNTIKVITFFSKCMHGPVEANSTWEEWNPHASRWHVIILAKMVFFGFFSDQIWLKM